MFNKNKKHKKEVIWHRLDVGSVHWDIDAHPMPSMGGVGGLQAPAWLG